MVKLDFDLWFPHLIEGGIIAFHDTFFHPMEGPRKVVIENIYKSRNFINIGLVGSITFAKKVSNNSLKDRLRNYCALLLRYIYELSFKFTHGLKRYLPKSMKRLGRKILRKKF